MMHWFVWLFDRLGLARDPSNHLAIDDERERELGRRLAALDVTIMAQQRRKAREEYDRVH